MVFTVFCDNKGCRKECTPLLDKADNKVYCTECSYEITTVTSFMKNQMVSLGQVKRHEKKQMAFSVECKKCKKSNPPVMKKKELYCAECGASMKHLAAPFALTIKQFLSSQSKEK